VFGILKNTQPKSLEINRKISYKLLIADNTYIIFHHKSGSDVIVTYKISLSYVTYKISLLYLLKTADFCDRIVSAYSKKVIFTFIGKVHK